MFLMRKTWFNRDKMLPAFAYNTKYGRAICDSLAVSLDYVLLFINRLETGMAPTYCPPMGPAWAELVERPMSWTWRWPAIADHRDVSAQYQRMCKESKSFSTGRLRTAIIPPHGLDRKSADAAY